MHRNLVAAKLGPGSIRQIQEGPKTFGLELLILVRVFPFLEEVLPSSDVQQSEDHQSPLDAKYRLVYAFCRFLRVVKKHFRLVFVLDDLQWADVASLDLLEAILNDSDSSKGTSGGLLLVGIYRSNEVDETHLLSLTLRNFRRLSDVEK